MAFSQKALYELQLADEAFAAAMRLAIARTLSHKLGAARASTGALQCINQPVAARLRDVHSTHWLICAQALLAQRTRRGREGGRRRAQIMNPADERLFQSTFARLGVGSDARGALRAASAVNTDGDALMRTVIREMARPRPGRLESGGAAAFSTA